MLQLVADSVEQMVEAELEQEEAELSEVGQEEAKVVPLEVDN